MMPRSASAPATAGDTPRSANVGDCKSVLLLLWRCGRFD
jgi:hypothetical protein